MKKVRVSRAGVIKNRADLAIESRKHTEELDTEPSVFKGEVMQRVRKKLNKAKDREFLQRVGIRGAV